jgi:HEAT repeat protein
MRKIVAAAAVAVALALPSAAWASDLAHARQTLRADASPAARATAANVLAAEGDTADVALLAQQLRTDADADVRAACARALGILGGDAALAALRAATGDPSSTVRGFVRAAIALASPPPLPRAPTDAGRFVATVYIPGHDLVILTDGTHQLQARPAVHRAHRTR